MTDPAGTDELAASLFGSIRLIVHSSRKARPAGDLSAGEMAALQLLKRAGQNTSAALARTEGITPQAMGATLAALESRGLIERSKDPDDGRRVLLSLTDAGLEVMAAQRSARTAGVAKLLRERFTAEEIAQLQQAAPLIERLAEEI